jgi:hypothetical protein
MKERFLDRSLGMDGDPLRFVVLKIVDRGVLI